MAASALNNVSIGPVGASAPGAKSSAASGPGAMAGGGNPLASFEGLIATLFPGEAPLVSTPAATAPGASSAANTGVDTGGVATDGDAPKAESDIETLTSDAAPNAGDANAVLLASVLAAQPAVVETPPATTAPVTTSDTPPGAAEAGADASAFTLDTNAPPAWGRHKAKGGPAAPALANANAKAGLPGKVELAPEAAPELGDASEIDLDPQADANLAVETPKSAAQPLPRSVAQGLPEVAPHPLQTPRTASSAPTAPAAEPTVTPDAVAAAAPATEAAPVDTAAVQTPPTAAGPAPALTARPEPAPTPQANSRPARSDRAKSSGEITADSSALNPTEAVDRPVHARAAQAAAKPASAEVEVAAAPEAKTEQAEPDTADFQAQAETRAASQSAAPAAHTTHAVRGSPETVANLAAQIVKKLEGRSTRFDVELDPLGLGKVDVRIEIGAHGRMTAAMVCDNPQAAAELKARSAELHKAMEQAGFDLSGGLSFDVAQDQGGRQGQAWQDQGDTNAGRAFRGQAFRAALDTAGDAADAAISGALRLRRGVNAGLDVRI